MYIKLFTLAVFMLLFTFTGHAQTVDTTEDAEYLRNWKVENTFLYKKQRKDGRLLTAAGGAALGSGLALAGVGISFLVTTRNYDEDNIDTPMPGKRIAGIILTLYGGLSAMSGTGMFVAGIHNLQQAKALKEKARKRGVELSYMPYVSPVGNSYGMYVSLKF